MYVYDLLVANRGKQIQGQEQEQEQGKYIGEVERTKAPLQTGFKITGCQCSMLVNLSTILLILLVLCCETRGRPAREHVSMQDSQRPPLQVSSSQKKAEAAAAATAAPGAGERRTTAAARIGSRPPSCINKCDSCTPCQAVQASQQSLAQMSSNIGSRPPSCQNKCNRCIPCQAVQVPTPIERKAPVLPRDHEQSPLGSRQEQQQEQVSVEYSNYKPEGWRCKCGNKLFNP